MGALDADPVPAAAPCRRRRVLRPAHPLVHGALEGARPHRHPRGAEGSAEHAQEPLRPPPRARHQLRLHQGLDDAVGPDPLRGDLPELGWRMRHGAGQRVGGEHRLGAGRLDQGHCDAVGADHVSQPRHRAPRGGSECAADVYAQAGHRPRKEVDCVEMYVPFSWFEPMWLEDLHFAPSGEGGSTSRTASPSSTGTSP